MSCFVVGIVCKVGERHNSVVLHVDPIANCVQLTLNKEVIKAVENFKDNKFTKVGKEKTYFVINISVSLQLITVLCQEFIYSQFCWPFLFIYILFVVPKCLLF